MDDIIKETDDALRNYFRYVQELPGLYEKMLTLGVQLNHMGVSSPTIRSKDEAFYQRGSADHRTDGTNILDLMEQEERTYIEYKYKSLYCYNIQEIFVELPEDEMQMIAERYDQCIGIRRMALARNISKSTMSERFGKLLEKIYSKM